MRTMLLATAAALAVIATPAAARDNSAYVGVEAGLLFPKDTNLDVTVDGTDVFDKAFTVNHKTGWDGDLIGGYDFGMFRVEGELGYKRSKNDSFDVDPLLLDAIEADLGSPVTPADLELDGRTSVVSGMLNGMLDFGGNTGVGAYVGGGVGVAGVKFSAGGESDRDSGLAWQFLAGIRAPVSPNIDVGLKYRYFQTKKLNFDTAFDTVDTGLSGRFKSHSLLASLVYNFGAPVAVAPPPPPPPPPPPEAPATQTCPDGSVVLATSSCPLPPPPPPPPPSSGERGR